jgi:6-phosphogluconolactonase/glucosamine-6-phosphate isomerase/deaminase
LPGDRRARGRRSLAVSGGNRRRSSCFEVLSKPTIQWDRVTVMLVDERIVPPADSERANQRLVREKLLTGHAAEAHFVPSTTGKATPQENAAAQRGNPRRRALAARRRHAGHGNGRAHGLVLSRAGRRLMR